MATTKKRVSYVFPTAYGPLPVVRVGDRPRERGAAGPFYEVTGDSRELYSEEPGHRMPVQSLVLDSMHGRLYTGGRDGYVKCWDLNLERRAREDYLSLETAYRLEKRSAGASTNACLGSSAVHTDWVNDLALCDYNRAVVSASSDSSIAVWRPEAPPVKIGEHSDYARALASIPSASYVISGGFDHKINIWDINRSYSGSPLLQITSSASTYSLSATNAGTLVAVGSPERVVKTYDLRSKELVSKLGGHADNVRAVTFDAEGRWLLTASSDSTVKLWSLTAQKCLHTFTHHSTGLGSSVWALYSDHPSLKVFYSGDKHGHICKVDLEGTGDPREGECILVGQDRATSDFGAPGITQMVAQDSTYIWTAAGSSAVKRWADVPSRSQRYQGEAGSQRYQGEAGYHSPATDASPNPFETPNPFSSSGVLSTSPSASPVLPMTPATTSRRGFSNSPAARGSPAARPSPIPASALIPLDNVEDAYFSSLFIDENQHHHRRESMDAELSLFAHGRPRTQSVISRHSTYLDRATVQDARPVSEAPDGAIPGAPGLLRCELLNDRRHALTLDTRGDVLLWDIVRARCVGVLDDAQARRIVTDAFTPPSSFFPRAASHVMSLAPSESSSGGTGADASQKMLTSLRKALEGELATVPWCTCDTRTGELTVHLDGDKIYDTDLYTDELVHWPEAGGGDEKIVWGAYALSHLLYGFAAGKSGAPGALPASHTTLGAPPVSPSHSSPTKTRRKSSLVQGRRPSHLGQINGVPSPQNSGLASSAHISYPPLWTFAQTLALSQFQNRPLSPPASPSFSHTRFAVSVLTPSSVNALLVRDPNNADVHEIMSIKHSAVERQERPVTDDLTSTSLQKESVALAPSPTKSTPATAPPPTSDGKNRFSRLKFLSKSGSSGGVSRKESKAIRPSTSVVKAAQAAAQTTAKSQPPDLSTVASRIVYLFNSNKEYAARLAESQATYPQNLQLVVSERDFERAQWRTVYRGTNGTAANDADLLEKVLPLWAVAWATGEGKPRDDVKISFTVDVWRDAKQSGLVDIEIRGESKLTASRGLRIEKIIEFVRGKLVAKVATETEKEEMNTVPIEILCSDTVVPPHTSLACVKAFYWKGSGMDVVLTYRRKTE